MHLGHSPRGYAQRHVSRPTPRSEFSECFDVDAPLDHREKSARQRSALAQRQTLRLLTDLT